MGKNKDGGDEHTPRYQHRWTTAQSQALLDFVDEHRSEFESIGQPGGVLREVFWTQVPGLLGIPVTWKSAHMEYRKLTSDSDWAKKRRGELKRERPERQKPGRPRKEVAPPVKEEQQRTTTEDLAETVDGVVAAVEHLRTDLLETQRQLVETQRAQATEQKETRRLMAQLLAVWTDGTPAVIQTAKTKAPTDHDGQDH